MTTSEERASESAIRALIERWAAAVHAADLETVLADHSDDIQMFDVPPPNEVRGIEDYRKTWPPFFEWQRRGAAFEIVSLRRHRGCRRCLRDRPAAMRGRGGAEDRIPTTACV